MQSNDPNRVLAPLVVELYGLPGSGKSTLARALAAADPERVCIVNVVSRGERARYLLRFIFQYPAPAWRLFWIFITNLRFGLIRYKFTLLTISIASSIKARSSACAVAIIDEGILQRLLSLYEREVSERDIQNMRRSLILPDCYVLFDGGDFGRFVGRENREESPRFGLGEEYLARWMQNLVHNDKVIQTLFTSLGIPAVVVDERLRSQVKEHPDMVLKEITSVSENTARL